MNTKQKYTKGSVTSKDGTIMGYRQMGSGPGIIIMYGGISSSQYYMKFGAALSDDSAQDYGKPEIILEELKRFIKRL